MWYVNVVVIGYLLLVGSQVKCVSYRHLEGSIRWFSNLNHSLLTSLTLKTLIKAQSGFARFRAFEFDECNEEKNCSAVARQRKRSYDSGICISLVDQTCVCCRMHHQSWHFQVSFRLCKSASLTGVRYMLQYKKAKPKIV
jgi:hypothetical protein